MVVKVKRVRTRPGLLQHKQSDSLTTIRANDDGKSNSVSSLRSNSSHHNSSHNKRRASVCFAVDYGSLNEIIPASPEPFTEEEHKLSFYSREELEKFDKDRALTVLMYKTRRNSGAPWDDNVHSLRGLEDVLVSCKKTTSASSDKPRKIKRQELLKAILNEQTRLKSDSGQQELKTAAKQIRKPPIDLQWELIRGVSCSMTKVDKQKAIALANKDEKSGYYVKSGSKRHLLKKVKSIWNSAKSISEKSEQSQNSTDDR